MRFTEWIKTKRDRGLQVREAARAEAELDRSASGLVPARGPLFAHRTELEIEEDVARSRLEIELQATEDQLAYLLHLLPVDRLECAIPVRDALIAIREELRPDPTGRPVR